MLYDSLYCNIVVFEERVGYSIGIRVARAAFKWINYLFIYFTTAWYMGWENGIIFSKKIFKKV